MVREEIRQPASVSLLTVEEPFRLMVEAVVDDAVFLLDPEGFVFTWNGGAERILGYRAEEIIGRHFSVFYPPAAVAAGLPEHELAAAAAEGRYQDEGWRVRKDGSRFWADAVMTGLRDAEGGLLGFGKVTRDVSARHAAEQALRDEDAAKAALGEDLARTRAYEKKLQEQLEQEQALREKRIEALSHMAGGLAHEISNPLAIIHARASDLQALACGMERVPAEQVREACRSILSTSDRALRILKGLRGFAREAGKDPMEWTAIEDIVQQAVDTQQTRYERHRVELRVELQPELPLLLCREIQIGQIVTNLLNNAFDAIQQAQSSERWVLLRVGTGSGELWLEVTDSGPAIAEETRKHMMEPFFTTKTAGVGMGVGLSLSRAIAEDHGGRLALKAGSEHTCMRLELPIESEAAAGKEVEDASRRVDPSN